MKIGFVGLGVMGLPMAENLLKKSDHRILGYDIDAERMQAFADAGGQIVSQADELYRSSEIIMQMLPTHESIIQSVERACELAAPGSIIIDLSSAAPHIIQKLYQMARSQGKYLMDSPVSGGNPKAKDGTLAIMAGGDKEIFRKVKPLLSCMGQPVYTGGPGSGDVTKLVNNSIGGAWLCAIAEGYAFAARAGINLETTFEATRTGFLGGPLYDNKVPKILQRDYEPGARIAVHLKDLQNAVAYAAHLGIRMPMTEMAESIMTWMKDNGYIDLDQAALVKYYETLMGVTVGRHDGPVHS